MAAQGIENLQRKKGKSYQLLLQVTLKGEIRQLQTFEDTITFDGSS